MSRDVSFEALRAVAPSVNQRLLRETCLLARAAPSPDALLLLADKCRAVASCSEEVAATFAKEWRAVADIVASGAPRPVRHIQRPVALIDALYDAIEALLSDAMPATLLAGSGELAAWTQATAAAQRYRREVGPRGTQGGSSCRS